MTLTVLTLAVVLALVLLSQTDAAKDYASALAKSILFYDAQRSGKLPGSNPIHWRGDSALNDCVVGGWYDAGDHVKFGLPASAATTVLLWSLNRFRDGYQKAGQLNQMYDSVKWGLEYFLNSWDPVHLEFVAQIGDGNLDHGYWGRPEDMTMDRPCLKINTTSPGSDIAAGTAAALAAGAIAYKTKGDDDYSKTLLTAAESLYAFAKNYRGIFNGSNCCYTSDDDRDEMCEASIWLYRATQNAQYLADARSFVDLTLAWDLSWSSKKPSCQLYLYEETQSDQYKVAIQNFFNNWLPGGTVSYTPCGLAWRSKWGSNREAANVAFLALAAAESGVDSDRLRKWAVEQINFILGDNNHDGGCFSYQIGYGTKYPTHPHHRGASCPDKPAPCGWDNFRATTPSPQVLVGAIVGGPEVDDSYEDKRDDYVLNEVALDYNAGFQGALAGIVHLQDKNILPTTNNKCPCAS
ncbi:endoglucanase A [Biomphalaria pfeifferi]|uniref:Endoglucanase n=1 Tax=Biomphalaria pfeifferi TaxID=112525 RepID=A0AAD8BTK5_BIOPF|nr:endoglucanase A [Biomphalaria pfeifferi]